MIFLVKKWKSKKWILKMELRENCGFWVLSIEVERLGRGVCIFVCSKIERPGQFPEIKPLTTFVTFS